MSPSPLTTIVCAYESEPSLLRKALTAATEQPCGPLLVVDMSRSRLVEKACHGLAGVEHVPFPESRGLSDSRNVGLRRTRTRHVLFLDSDAVPRPGWAAAMAAAFDGKGVGMVAARVVPAWEADPGRLRGSATVRDWLAMFDLGDAPLDVPRVVGTSFGLDRQAAGTDPFDVALGRAPGVALGHEEVRLALELRERGWRCRYAPDAVVAHHIPAERTTWRSLLTRAYVAGQESRLEPERLDPLPTRTMTAADHTFRALVAPAFLAGRLRSRG